MSLIIARSVGAWCISVNFARGNFPLQKFEAREFPNKTYFKTLFELKSLKCEMRNPRRLIKIPTGAYVLFLLLLYNLYRALLPINELCEELLEEEAETQQDIRKFILFTG